MTRACSSYANSPSPRAVKYTSLSSPHKTVSGGVAKSYRSSSPGRSLKTYVKARSTAECLQILKSLLPNARHQKKASELELVEETIAYITHLESILHPSPSPSDQELSYDQEQPSAVASATQMLEDMSV